MSHYLQASVRIGHRGGLVAALEELGFHPEVHDDPVHLFGVGGDERPELAHVVIPRHEVGRLANDVGFLEHDDGTWTVTVSDWDRGRYGPAWQAKVAHLAGVHADLLTAASLGLVAERVDNEDGTVDVYTYANE